VINFKQAIVRNHRQKCLKCGKEAFLRIIRQLLILLVIVIGMEVSASAQTMGTSPGNPTPKGTTISGILECGEGYTSHELYDMKITLLDLFRGEEAWKRIQEAAASNKPAAAGSEYILAKVKFDYTARNLPGACTHPLEPNQFTAYNASGEDYPAASAIPPKPEMRKRLKAGDTYEGWLVFVVSKEDKSPIMSFSAGDGGAVQHAEPKWFLLR
jgi:hypothetical protein